MAGGKNEKKTKKERKAKEEESIVFHDCESDNELVTAKSESQPDLSFFSQTLEDPSAFHKELQEIVSTTQQLLYKFDSQYKPAHQQYNKKSNRKTKNVSDSDRSIRSSKSLLLEIHFQVPIPVPANNITYHQVSTHNENTFQVLPTPPCFKPQLMDQTQNLFENIYKPIVCDEKKKPISLAGENKNIFKTESQTNISETSLFITPNTSASDFSILTSSQVDIQLLHSQSKLLTLQTLKNKKSSQSIQRQKLSKTLKKTQESKKEKSVVDFPSSTSMKSNTVRGNGANILFYGKRFLSSISTYMGGYVEENERKPDPSSKLPKKSSLSPKVSRTRQQKVRRKPKSSAKRVASSSKQFSDMPQFSFPPELTALGLNAQTMPAILLFMPPSVVNPNSQQDQQPIPLQALCIPFMIPADQPSQNPQPGNTKLNWDLSSATKEQNMVCTSSSKVQHLDVNQKVSQTSCTTFITYKTDCSCNDPSEMQDSCIIVTQLNELNEDKECGCCGSDTTMVPSECLVDIPPPIPEEPMEICCARSKRGNCVECGNITVEERESKPYMKNVKKRKTPCYCGLKYPETPNAKVSCTCNADGNLNDDCKLPLCIDKYGVCPCDCDNKESIVKCCKEAFQETCICADYNVPKFYRLALPQHKDLNLCIKCRFDPSPLIDSEGRVFCPGDCGCCLCPWHTRPTLSKDNLMLHEKVRVCVCRDRGTIFNLSPKNSKCNNPGNFDLCPCRERAEAKFLELFEKEMFKVDERELIQLSGPAVTLKDVREIIPLKDKQKSQKRRNEM